MRKTSISENAGFRRISFHSLSGEEVLQAAESLVIELLLFCGHIDCSVMLRSASGVHFSVAFHFGLWGARDSQIRVLVSSL